MLRQSAGRALNDWQACSVECRRPGNLSPVTSGGAKTVGRVLSGELKEIELDDTCGFELSELFSG